jgi:hypothetical protein
MGLVGGGGTKQTFLNIEKLPSIPVKEYKNMPEDT